MEFKTDEERNRYIEENRSLIFFVINTFIDKHALTGIYTCKDLEQEATLKFIELLKDYDETQSLSTYMVDSIKNHLYNILKRENYRVTNLSVEYADYYVENFDNESLSSLLKDYRSKYTNGIDALILSIEGFTYEEIAKKQNSTVAAVRSSIFRVKKELSKDKNFYIKLKSAIGEVY